MLANIMSAWSQPLNEIKKARKAAASLVGNQDQLLKSSVLNAWLHWASSSRRQRAEGVKQCAVLIANDSNMLIFVTQPLPFT